MIIAMLHSQFMRQQQLMSVTDTLDMQVLSPKTLVGSQLQPPVGLAKDWMWGQSNLRAALTQILGETGEGGCFPMRLPAAFPCGCKLLRMNFRSD